MAKQDEFVMPLHFKRFMASTQDWTDEEVGCYIRLLMHQWGKTSVPKELHRQKRIADSVEKNHWIVEQKFIDVDNGLQNVDMEEIRAERKLFSELQKQRREGNNRNSTESSPKHTPESKSGGISGELSGLGLEEVLVIKDESFEKSEKLLKNYDEWGQMILDGRDQGFEVELYNSGIDISEVTQDRMILYLGLLNTYPKKRPATQQQFRKSFLAYIVEQKQETKHGNKSSGYKTKHQSNSDHTANQLGRVLDGTL